MKVELTFWGSGKTWTERVEANNVTEARHAIEIRNPQAKVISANPVFK